MPVDFLLVNHRGQGVGVPTYKIGIYVLNKKRRGGGGGAYGADKTEKKNGCFQS